MLLSFLTKVLRSPEKLFYCLQNFLIHSEVFWSENKIRWEEKLYFINYIFSELLNTFARVHEIETVFLPFIIFFSLGVPCLGKQIH